MNQKRSLLFKIVTRSPSETEQRGMVCGVSRKLLQIFITASLFLLCVQCATQKRQTIKNEANEFIENWEASFILLSLQVQVGNFRHIIAKVQLGGSELAIVVSIVVCCVLLLLCTVGRLCPLDRSQMMDVCPLQQWILQMWSR